VFTARYGLKLYIGYNSDNCQLSKAVQWLRRVVTGLSSQRLGFDSGNMRDLWWIKWHSQWLLPLSVSFHHAPRTWCSYQDKWAKPGNLPKSKAVSEIRSIGEKRANNHWTQAWLDLRRCNAAILSLNHALLSDRPFQRWKNRFYYEVQSWYIMGRAIWVSKCREGEC